MAGLTLDLGKVDQDLAKQLEGGNDVEGEDMDPFSDEFSPDDQLTPVEKLDKYFQSDDLMEREAAVRTIIDASQYVTSYSEFELILEIVYALSSDHEPLIRIGILGTINFLVEKNKQFHRSDQDTPFFQENEDRMFEVFVKMLKDINQQVRRMSQNCVCSLLEESAPGSVDSLVQQLCPMIRRCLGKEENYDLRMDTALLMSRVATLLGRELCMQHFVPLLPSLASDAMFHVRKAFAMCCKEVCLALGKDDTEQHILPLFLQLCKDEVWGVRKACSDIFMDISSSCSLKVQQEKLTPAFLQLLRDDSRWVRKASFQALGPFISTFYIPPPVRNDDDSGSLGPLGDSVLMDNSLLGEDISSTNSPPSSTSTSQAAEQTGTQSSESQSEDSFTQFHFWRDPIPAIPELSNDKTADTTSQEGESSSPNVSGPLQSSNMTVSERSCTTGHCEVNSLGTAKVEIEEGEDDETLADVKDALLAESEGEMIKRVKNEEEDEDAVVVIGQPYSNSGFPQVRVFIQSATGQIHEETTDDKGLEVGDTPLGSRHDETTTKSVAMDMTLLEGVATDQYTAITTEQEIVPDELIELYLSMTNPQQAQTVDSDLPFYCAYSFPAVLRTLGADQWDMLKPTFDQLVNDVQWKIRRVLAYSLHELALILGQERACCDLLAVLDEYTTKDVDDVKLGVLTHLTELLSILPVEVRHDVLPSLLRGLLDTENERNWRYRDLLAEQLMSMCDILNVTFIQKHIVPISFLLVQDRVAQVRETAARLIGVTLQKMEQLDAVHCKEVLTKAKETLALSPRWLLRLLYAKLCSLFLLERRIPHWLFATECLPVLFTLSSDPVPNVKISLAHLLKDTVLKTNYFFANDTGTPLQDNIVSVLEQLKLDKDRDVRYFAGGPYEPVRRRTRTLCEDEDAEEEVVEETDRPIHISEAASLLDS